MDKPDTSSIVTASRELGQSFTEAAGLVVGMSEGMKEVNQLYDHGYGGAGKSMIRFGVALVMIPEPFLISDVIGCSIIAAGYLYNKISPPPMYVDDIFKSIEEQVKALHDDVESLPTDFNLDVSSMHFNF